MFMCGRSKSNAGSFFLPLGQMCMDVRSYTSNMRMKDLSVFGLAWFRLGEDFD